MGRPGFLCCPLKWRRPLPGCSAAACNPHELRAPRWYLGTGVTRPPHAGSATSQGFTISAVLSERVSRESCAQLSKRFPYRTFYDPGIGFEAMLECIFARALLPL
jgi:hypothetical protein